MADDAWNVGSSASAHRPSQETRPPHETKLLHELIIQAVTERRVDADPNVDYDKQLQATIKHIQTGDGYKQLLAKPDVNQSDVSALLDHEYLERLPTVDASHHVTLMMATGGPATGKSSIIKNIQQNYPATYRDAAKINPDDYKPLLADRATYGKAYADVSHAESSRLASDIMVRLEEKMATGQAPNIVMDVVATSEHRMNFAKQAGQLVVVTGTAPLEVTVPRAYERGLPEDGRRIPTQVVIEGARNVAVELPRIFEHPGVRFEVVDTNVPFGTPIKSVAQFDRSTSTLKISNPDTFIDLVERQNVNVNAHSPAELFKPQDRTPETIARDMKAYTDKGVRLAFLDPQGQVAMTISQDGVQTMRPLVSARGASFMPELAAAATALASHPQVADHQQAQTNERTPAEPNASQGKPGASQTPVVVLSTNPPQGEHTSQTPPPVLVTRVPPPEEIELPKPGIPGKIGMVGVAAQLAIGPVYEAGLTAANDGNAHDIAKAGLHGLANAALPGVTDGFKNITQNNSHQNWVDQTLNAGTTATQGTAVGALAVAGGATVAAPVTGGTSLTVTAGSLVVAGVAGVANVGIGLVHDVTYVTGASKQGGLVTGVVNMVGQLADSKAAHRAEDWVMGNNAKVEHELAAKGISQKQLAGVDENKDGSVTAQEARDYLIKHHVAADKVNILPAQALADTLATTLKAEAPAAHANLSPDMLRALGAAKGISLSTAIQHDAGHEAAPHRANVAHSAAPAQSAAYSGR